MAERRITGAARAGGSKAPPRCNSGAEPGAEAPARRSCEQGSAPESGHRHVSSLAKADHETWMGATGGWHWAAESGKRAAGVGGDGPGPDQNIGRRSAGRGAGGSAWARAHSECGPGQRATDLENSGVNGAGCSGRPSFKLGAARILAASQLELAELRVGSRSRADGSGPGPGAGRSGVPPAGWLRQRLSRANGHGARRLQ